MVDAPFPILFEDEEILVINKPAGITVNKSETTIHEQTVQDWTEKYLQLQINNPDELSPDSFYRRGGVVHRLDKETSGILLLAKTEFAFTALQRQFKERLVTKGYIALAHGKITPKNGEIRAPVGRVPWNRTQFGVIAGGRESVTLYDVIDYYALKSTHETLSYVSLKPETGRTHQIRVHLKYIGHPIFSDFLYAGRKTARDDRKIVERVFLHAASLLFQHPKTNQQLAFSAELPHVLASVLTEQCYKIL
jgi:23S rRNA pseudouridine1911/1915/1917 synthase